MAGSAIQSTDKIGSASVEIIADLSQFTDPISEAQAAVEKLANAPVTVKVQVDTKMLTRLEAALDRLEKFQGAGSVAGSSASGAPSSTSVGGGLSAIGVALDEDEVKNVFKNALAAAFENLGAVKITLDLQHIEDQLNGLSIRGVRFSGGTAQGGAAQGGAQPNTRTQAGPSTGGPNPQSGPDFTAPASGPATANRPQRAAPPTDVYQQIMRDQAGPAIRGAYKALNDAFAKAGEPIMEAADDFADELGAIVERMGGASRTLGDIVQFGDEITERGPMFGARPITGGSAARYAQADPMLQARLIDFARNAARVFSAPGFHQWVSGGASSQQDDPGAEDAARVRSHEMPGSATTQPGQEAASQAANVAAGVARGGTVSSGGAIRVVDADKEQRDAEAREERLKAEAQAIRIEAEKKNLLGMSMGNFQTGKSPGQGFLGRVSMGMEKYAELPMGTNGSGIDGLINPDRMVAGRNFEQTGSFGRFGYRPKDFPHLPTKANAKPIELTALAEMAAAGGFRGWGMVERGPGEGQMVELPVWEKGTNRYNPDTARWEKEGESVIPAGKSGIWGTQTIKSLGERDLLRKTMSAMGMPKEAIDVALGKNSVLSEAIKRGQNQYNPGARPEVDIIPLGSPSSVNWGHQDARSLRSFEDEIAKEQQRLDDLMTVPGTDEAQDSLFDAIQRAEQYTAEGKTGFARNEKERIGRINLDPGTDLGQKKIAKSQERLADLQMKRDELTVAISQHASQMDSAESREAISGGSKYGSPWIDSLAFGAKDAFESMRKTGGPEIDDLLREIEGVFEEARTGVFGQGAEPYDETYKMKTGPTTWEERTRRVTPTGKAAVQKRFNNILERKGGVYDVLGITGNKRKRSSIKGNPLTRGVAIWMDDVARHANALREEAAASMEASVRPRETSAGTIRESEIDRPTPTELDDELGQVQSALDLAVDRRYIPYSVAKGTKGTSRAGLKLDNNAPMGQRRGKMFTTTSPGVYVKRTVEDLYDRPHGTESWTRTGQGQRSGYLTDLAEAISNAGNGIEAPVGKMSGTDADRALYKVITGEDVTTLRGEDAQILKDFEDAQKAWLQHAAGGPEGTGMSEAEWKKQGEQLSRARLKTEKVLSGVIAARTGRPDKPVRDAIAKVNREYTRLVKLANSPSGLYERVSGPSVSGPATSTGMPRGEETARRTDQTGGFAMLGQNPQYLTGDMLADREQAIADLEARKKEILSIKEQVTAFGNQAEFGGHRPPQGAEGPYMPYADPESVIGRMPAEWKGTDYERELRGQLSSRMGGRLGENIIEGEGRDLPGGDYVRQRTFQTPTGFGGPLPVAERTPLQQAQDELSRRESYRQHAAEFGLDPDAPMEEPYQPLTPEQRDAAFQETQRRAGTGTYSMRDEDISQEMGGASGGLPPQGPRTTFSGGGGLDGSSGPVPVFVVNDVLHVTGIGGGGEAAPALGRNKSAALDIAAGREGNDTRKPGSAIRNAEQMYKDEWTREEAELTLAERYGKGVAKRAVRKAWPAEPVAQQEAEENVTQAGPYARNAKGELVPFSVSSAIDESFPQTTRNELSGSARAAKERELADTFGSRYQRQEEASYANLFAPNLDEADRREAEFQASYRDLFDEAKARADQADKEAAQRRLPSSGHRAKQAMYDEMFGEQTNAMVAAQIEAEQKARTAPSRNTSQQRMYENLWEGQDAGVFPTYTNEQAVAQRRREMEVAEEKRIRALEAPAATGAAAATAGTGGTKGARGLNATTPSTDKVNAILEKYGLQGVEDPGIDLSHFDETGDNSYMTTMAAARAARTSARGKIAQRALSTTAIQWTENVIGGLGSEDGPLMRLAELDREIGELGKIGGQRAKAEARLGVIGEERKVLGGRVQELESKGAAVDVRDLTDVKKRFKDLGDEAESLTKDVATLSEAESEQTKKVNDAAKSAVTLKDSMRLFGAGFIGGVIGSVITKGLGMVMEGLGTVIEKAVVPQMDRRMGNALLAAEENRKFSTSIQQSGYNQRLGLNSAMLGLGMSAEGAAGVLPGLMLGAGGLAGAQQGRSRIDATIASMANLSQARQLGLPEGVSPQAVRTQGAAVSIPNPFGGFINFGGEMSYEESLRNALKNSGFPKLDPYGDNTLPEMSVSQIDELMKTQSQAVKDKYSGDMKSLWNGEISPETMVQRLVEGGIISAPNGGLSDQQAADRKWMLEAIGGGNLRSATAQEAAAQADKYENSPYLAGLAKDMEAAGVVFTGELENAGDAAKRLSEIFRGVISADQAIATAQETQLPNQAFMFQKQFELQGQQLGAGLALQSRSNPLMPFGVGLPGGISGVEDIAAQAATLTDQLDGLKAANDVQLNTAISALPSQATPFGPSIQQQAKETLAAIDANTESMLEFQVAASKVSANQAMREYSRNLYLAQRQVSDLAGMVGAAGASEIGILEKQNLLASRKLQLLQFEEQQRSLNFQRGMAGFMFEGVTGEEAADRQRINEIRVAKEQEKLDLSKGIFGRGVKIVDEQNMRAFQDAVYQAKELEKRFNESKRLGALSDALERAKRLDNQLQNQMNRFLSASNTLQQEELAFAKQVADTAATTLDKVYEKATKAFGLAIAEMQKVAEDPLNYKYEPPEDEKDGRSGLPGYGDQEQTGDSNLSGFARLAQGGQRRQSGGSFTVTVNFNNPTVRNDQDLQHLAAQVEKVLARKASLMGFQRIRPD